MAELYLNQTYQIILITFYPRIIDKAFHGTSIDCAQNIISQGCFSKSLSDFNYLGEGVYFYEYSKQHAFTFIKRKLPTDEIAILESTLDLGNCLDLNNEEHSIFVSETANKLIEKTSDNTINDGVVIEFICSVSLKIKIDSVRANYTNAKIGKIFKGSHFYAKSEMIVCMRTLANIKSIKICKGEIE